MQKILFLFISFVILSCSTEQSPNLGRTVLYPKLSQYYNLTEVNNTWIVDGPYQMGGEEEKMALQGKVLKEPAPTPINTPQTNVFSSPAPGITEENTVLHPAEITPKGDLVHYVTFPEETLLIITQWYTKDPSNVEAIARINGIKEQDHLTPGNSIIIPGYLVRNKNVLPEVSIKMQMPKASLDQNQPSSVSSVQN